MENKITREIAFQYSMKLVYSMSSLHIYFISSKDMIRNLFIGVEFIYVNIMKYIF